MFSSSAESTSSSWYVRSALSLHARENDWRIDASVGSTTGVSNGDVPVSTWRLDAGRVGTPLAVTAACCCWMWSVKSMPATVSASTGSASCCSFLSTRPHLRRRFGTCASFAPSDATTHVQLFESKRYSTPGRSLIWHSAATLTWQPGQWISNGTRTRLLALTVRVFVNRIGGDTCACECSGQLLLRAAAAAALARLPTRAWTSLSKCLRSARCAPRSLSSTKQSCSLVASGREQRVHVIHHGVVGSDAGGIAGADSGGAAVVPAHALAAGESSRTSLSSFAPQRGSADVVPMLLFPTICLPHDDTPDS